MTQTVFQNELQREAFLVNTPLGQKTNLASDVRSIPQAEIQHREHHRRLSRNPRHYVSNPCNQLSRDIPFDLLDDMQMELQLGMNIDSGKLVSRKTILLVSISWT